ncbi:MAG: DinB family protein [Ardenticatenaceae bacterium]|nr:DinB family protein [Anaerolineales bacterium]MCB8920340.1 DinB family protein [Ardenticatenaceae bacterium]
MSNRTETIEALQVSRRELLAALERLDDGGWETAVFPHDDQSTWTAADLLRHLAESERSMTRLMANIKAGGPGASPDFDLARWNASRVAKAQHKSPADLLNDIAAYRQELLQFMDSLQEEDWSKKGRHGTGNIMSIAEICSLIAAHEAQHTADIQKVVGE